MIIKSSNGIDIILDDNCPGWITKERIFVTKHGYATFSAPHRIGFKFVHHAVVGTKTDLYTTVDHINMNKLDNRSANLRVIPKSLNQINKGKNKGSYNSRFKGVATLRMYWRAYININKVRHELGTFDTEVDAARAYNLQVIINLGYDYVMNDTGDNYDFYTPIPRIRSYNKPNTPFIKDLLL